MSHRRTSSKVSSNTLTTIGSRRLFAPPTFKIGTSDAEMVFLSSEGKKIDLPSPTPSPSKELHHPIYTTGPMFRSQNSPAATTLISSTSFATGIPSTFPATPTPGTIFDFEGRALRADEEGKVGSEDESEDEGETGDEVTNYGNEPLECRLHVFPSYSPSPSPIPTEIARSFRLEKPGVEGAGSGWQKGLLSGRWKGLVGWWRGVSRAGLGRTWSNRRLVLVGLGVWMFLLLVCVLKSQIREDGRLNTRLVVDIDGTSSKVGKVTYDEMLRGVKMKKQKEKEEQMKLLELDKLKREEVESGSFIEGMFRIVAGKIGCFWSDGLQTNSQGGKGVRDEAALDPDEEEEEEENLLGLDQIPRRYRFGAYSRPPSTDEETSDTSLEWEEADFDPEEEESEVPGERRLKRLYKAGKKKYEAEEPFWRKFVWEAPKVHESLAKFLALLDEDELALRSWIIEMRQIPQPPAFSVGVSPRTDASLRSNYSRIERVGEQLNDDELSPKSGKIGVQQRLPLERRVLRLADDDPSASRTVRARLSNQGIKIGGFAGPAEFSGGNLVKWGLLDQEAREELGGTCEGAKWLNEYKLLHEEMMSGERQVKIISYHCEQGMPCGGLGDRMMAITSAFFFALITNRAFFAEFQHPVPLDTVFDSPFIDWSMSSFALEQHPILSNLSLQGLSADLDIVNFEQRAMDQTFSSIGWNPTGGERLQNMEQGMERRDMAFHSPWIKFFANSGLVYRSFSYPHLQHRIEQLGLRPLTAFSCIFNYIFRPKPVALRYISEYTSVLSLPTVFSVGIQIQTGGLSETDATVDSYKSFFKCAEQLAEAYMLPDQRLVFILVTDSARLRGDAIKQFGDVVVVPAESRELTGREKDVHDVYSAVVDSSILSKTDYRVITRKSSFGKLAEFRSAYKSTTVTIPSLGSEDETSRQSRVNLDCRLESAFWGG